MIPCVNWPLDGTAPDDCRPEGPGEVWQTPTFQDARFEPPVAANCACRGGCARGRTLNGRLDAHDDYCPWVRGEEIKLDWRPAPAKDLMRSGNVCTTVVV